MIKIIISYVMISISCHHIPHITATVESNLRYSKAITLLTFDVDGTLIKVCDFQEMC